VGVEVLDPELTGTSVVPVDTSDGLVTQAQRLEAVGLFAGGIVHDFNNMLTAILGYTELARTHLPEGHPVLVDLDQVMASAERASAITRKLLAFTRRQVLVPVNVDPAQVIDDLVPILRPLMGIGVDIEVDAGAKHGWVRVDPTEIEQIIVNLLVNARDAMPAGGTATVTIQDAETSNSDLPAGDVSTGAFVRISVSDTGLGMDEATKARIFDPFYTTKSLGKGTGLGLATVLGIVNRCGGRIQVDTSPGKGSTFSVDLPRVGFVALPDRRGSAARTRRPSGVVLLVEDDSAVREFARRSLEGVGYTVLAAAGGDQALVASENWGDRIDVLLTDIGMIGVSGPELAVRINARRPGIGVVFMSGSAGDPAGEGVVLDAAAVFIPKPFSAEALSRAVARAADIGRHIAR
jgi:two-component system cell cycle sensor histidine kinase/response regulator CckA